MISRKFLILLFSGTLMFAVLAGCSAKHPDSSDNTTLQTSSTSATTTTATAGTSAATTSAATASAASTQPTTETTAATDPASTSVSDSWDRNVTEHWKNADDGTRLEIAKHTMKDVICEVCGTEIWVFEDGAADLYDYNEYGDWTRISTYDSDGTLSYDTVYEYEYDEDGNKLRECAYDALDPSHFLIIEVIYGQGSDGAFYPLKESAYYEDGTSAVNEYADGNLVDSYTYNADGSVSFHAHTEYAYDNDQIPYIIKETSTGEDGSKLVLEYNEYGDSVRSSWYLADGTLDDQFIHENEYDKDGKRLKRITYFNGVLTEEYEYGYFEDDFGTQQYEKRYTEYLDDGTKTVYEYDKEGNEISRTTYNADGSKVK